MFIEPSDRQHPDFSARGLLENLKRHSASQVLSRRHANVFVVDSVTKLGDASHLVAVLLGRPVMDMRYFMSNGKVGISYTPQKALATNRVIWISPGFSDEFPVMCSILRWVVQLPDSKWKFLAGDAHTFRAKATSKRHAGLATDADRDCQGLRGCRFVYSLGALLQWLLGQGQVGMRVTGTQEDPAGSS